MKNYSKYSDEKLNDVTNCDFVYYIISCSEYYCGLFSLFLYILTNVVYADENGYLPIVDLQHGYNQYFKDGCMFKENPWEYYFEQPANVSLDNVDFKNCKLKYNIGFTYRQTKIAFEEKNNFSSLVDVRVKDKKFFNRIKFNKETQIYLDNSYNDIFANESEVLGVLCRGTDFSSTQPYSHSIQPTPELVIKKVKELYSRYKYKKIWLATEDLGIYQKFKKEFGEILLPNPQYLYSSDTKESWLADIKVKRENHSYLLGKEYLRSIYLLSKCKYLILGLTSGATGLYILSNGFSSQEFVCLFNLGCYGIDSKPTNFKYNRFIEKLFSIKSEWCIPLKYKVITLLGFKIKLKRFAKFVPDIEYTKTAGTL